MLQYPIYPTAVNLEITNRCNLHCSMCLREDMTYDEGFMSLELYEGLVQEIGHIGVPKLRLHWRGEPMLHPKWAQMVKCAKEAGIRSVVLFTNGTVLNERNRQSVFDSGLDEIHFSLDGYSPEIFELVRKGSDFGKVIESIHLFLEERARHASQIEVVVRFTKLTDNEHEVKEFCRYWGPLVHDIIITDDTRDHISSKSADIGHTTTQRLELCHDLSKEMFVSWDGLVFPCYVSWNGELLLGDANHQTLKEIWQGSVLFDLRFLHEQNRREEIQLCANCKVDQCDIYSLRRGSFRRVGIEV